MCSVCSDSKNHSEYDLVHIRAGASVGMLVFQGKDLKFGRLETEQQRGGAVLRALISGKCRVIIARAEKCPLFNLIFNKTISAMGLDIITAS